MNLTRRQFLGAALGVAAAPAIAKLESAERAVFGVDRIQSGYGWEAVDRGEFWEVVMHDGAVMSGEHWEGKPLDISAGDNVTICNCTFRNAPVNMARYGPGLSLRDLDMRGVEAKVPALNFSDCEYPFELRTVVAMAA